MPDKLTQLFDEWNKNSKDVTQFGAFAGGFTKGAVSMRERAIKLAQTKTGNDLINAIGSLSDIPS
jgi:hypothetical protein